MVGRRKRRYPPSYVRYNERYPAVGVRVNKELKEFLDKLRMGEGCSQELC